MLFRSNKKKLKNSILSFLYDKPGQTINYKQVSSWLGVKDDEGRRLVNVALQEMSDDETLEQVSRGSFRLKARTGTICGIVELQQQGFAYINSEEAERPVMVSARNLNHAMDGDKVRVLLYARRKKHDLEGEVTEIVERAKTHFVGTIEMSQNFALDRKSVV